MKAILTNSITINGKVYDVPARTRAIQTKLAEHDTLIDNGTFDEYEGNMNLLEIFFGTEAANEINPKGEEVDLDELQAICQNALNTYFRKKTEAESKAIEEKLAPMNKVISKVETAANSFDKISK